MQIKAQGLFNAASWIEQTFGQAALRDVLRECSNATRERYTSATAINWHPVEELVELLGVADRLLGTGDRKIAIEIGAAGARVNTRTMIMRLALYVAKPDMLVRRLATFWRQYNDEGELLVREMTARGTRIELIGIEKPYALFCETITGWCREMTNATGGKGVSAQHVECRGRGQAHCIWEVRWLPVEAEKG